MERRLAAGFAVEVQLAICARNADLSKDRRIFYRVGIIIVENETGFEYLTP